MAKRPLKRNVKIVMKGRVKTDPFAIFDAVEKAFRPGNIEIHVEGEDIEIPMLPDEQLETAALEHVAEVLDQEDQRAAASPATPSVVRSLLTISTRRVQLGEWLKQRAATCWRITVKVLPVAEQVVKLVKAVKDL